MLCFFAFISINVSNHCFVLYYWCVLCCVQRHSNIWHHSKVRTISRIYGMLCVCERNLELTIKNLTLNRLYGLNCRTSSTAYSEKNEWLRTSVAVNRCFGSTTSIREIWTNHADSLIHSCVIKTFLRRQILMSLKWFQYLDNPGWKGQAVRWKTAYQVFNGVGAVLPFWRWEFVLPSQDHAQHQHLFPVPEGRRACKQRVHDHPWTPSAGINQRKIKHSS